MTIENTPALKEQLNQWQNHLNTYGPRLTANDTHIASINWLKDEIQKLDYQVTSDIHYLNFWEANDYHLRTVDQELPLSSYFPYSGLTPDTGVTAPLVFADTTVSQDVSGKIPIFILDVIAEGVVPFNSEQIMHPMNISGIAIKALETAKAKGAVGGLFIWKNLSPELAGKEILPFQNEFMDIPAVWTNEDQIPALQALADAATPVTLTLTGNYVEHKATESFFVKIPGTDASNNESLLLTTHTDGPNAVEENGPVALLTVLKYLKDSQTTFPQTLIVAFVSGHFQQRQMGPNDAKATGRWLDQFPELWDGKDHHLKAKFALTLEHLGCLHLYDDENHHFVKTTNVQEDYVYVHTDDTIKQILTDKLQAFDGKDDISFVDPTHVAYFGEGMPIFKRGIPNMATITMPEWLFLEPLPFTQPNMDLMSEQIDTAIAILEAVSQA
ncbi:hypothetical protein D3P96_02005 [Weissella viridescens]|uniref:Peptidase M28 domain-containing protein n=1 Tax=Weissella viridescens TaxID=1629 RepID=A0A3P2RJ57_WEIVI|nr:hypothetical protein [Weissella viridescens]RRG18780.1 hypothetical protein D3P96_02005 [Weissella viridescens]